MLSERELRAKRAREDAAAWDRRQAEARAEQAPARADAAAARAAAAKQEAAEALERMQAGKRRRAAQAEVEQRWAEKDEQLQKEAADDRLSLKRQRF